MKKFICALLIICLLSMTFFASCGGGEVRFEKPAYDECEEAEFTVVYPRSHTARTVKKVVVNKEDIVKILNYVNNAELTFAEDRYTGALFGGYDIKVSFIYKDGSSCSFLVSGKMLVDKGTLPFYTDENFKDGLLEIYASIDAEEQVIVEGKDME